jgi:hypothetical protein
MTKFMAGFITGALAMLAASILYELYFSLGDTDGGTH